MKVSGLSRYVAGASDTWFDSKTSIKKLLGGKAYQRISSIMKYGVQYADKAFSGFELSPYECFINAFWKYLQTCVKGVITHRRYRLL